MQPIIRQQRAALRRQRRRRRQARQAANSHRHWIASPHLGRRVRSSDIHSLDEQRRRIAQAILNRRHRTRQSQMLTQNAGTTERAGEDNSASPA